MFYYKTEKVIDNEIEVVKIFTNQIKDKNVNELSAYLKEKKVACQIWNFAEITSLSKEESNNLFFLISNYQNILHISFINVKEKLKNQLADSGINTICNIFEDEEKGIEYYKNEKRSKSCGLPKEINCPICGTKMLLKINGRIKCNNCKTAFMVGEKGEISL